MIHCRDSGFCYLPLKGMEECKIYSIPFINFFLVYSIIQQRNLSSDYFVLNSMLNNKDIELKMYKWVNKSQYHKFRDITLNL